MGRHVCWGLGQNKHLLLILLVLLLLAMRPTELVDLRARRLQELQRQAAERQVASSQGYGQLNDVPGAKLLVRVWLLSYGCGVG